MPADPLAEIAAAAALLERAGHHAIADWLRSRPSADLLEHLAGRSRRGFSPALARGVAERNRALTQAWRQQWADLPIREAARLLEVSLRRYHGSAWRHEQHALTNPHPPGAARYWYWTALQARARPLSARQIQRVLASNDRADHLSRHAM
jgi:hypothetical protein